MASPNSGRRRRQEGQPARQSVPAAEADAVLAAARVLVAITVRSLAALEDEVTLTQLRILVVITSSGTTTLSSLAAATGLHLSKASRTCDRMVGLGLLERADDPADRRNLQLTVTPRGKQVVGTVARARRAAITRTLTKLAPARRAELVSVLTEFTDAGGEPAGQDLWALGWAT